MTMNGRPADRLRRAGAWIRSGALAAIILVAGCGGRDAPASPGTTPGSPGSAGVATANSGTAGASEGSHAPAVRTPGMSLTPRATPGTPTVPTAPAVPTATVRPSAPRSSPAPPPLPSQPPAPSTMDEYTVVAGDTLSGIAGRHAIGLALLVAANPQIRDPDLILVGDRVLIPVLVDVGTLGGPTARVSGINELGQAVGTSDLAEANVYHAVRWQDGVLEDLGTLGGFLSQAVEVNDRGQVVGTATASRDNGAPWRAVLWDGGAIVDLGSLGGPTSMAHAINNAGQVVGTTTAPDGSGRAFIWQDGAMTDLGSLGGATGTVPTAINDLGQVVGGADTASGARHAFLWQDGAMQDLGTLGGAWSEAADVNDRGQVVGVGPLVGDEYDSWHAFLWQDGAMQDLGTLGGTWSAAYAVNDAGQVVGSSTTADGVKHPFLWQDGVMTELEMLQGCRGEGVATDLNDRAQIVGTCLLQFGEHPFFHTRNAHAAMPAITLATPRAGAGIAQNVPSTGCKSQPGRGYGFTVGFSWAVPDASGVSRYRLVMRRAGFRPALDVTAAVPRYTWTSCNAFVVDSNLPGWHWRVAALDERGQEIAASEWRPIGFLPCRLVDGTACNALR
jgi:probable HAF family extracellular repeat protein